MINEKIYNHDENVQKYPRDLRFYIYSIYNIYYIYPKVSGE